MKTLLTTLALLASLGSAHAGPSLTSANWIKFCENYSASRPGTKQLVYQAACTMYARGVADGLDLWVNAGEDSAPVCIPSSVTAEQLVAVGQKFYKDNPKDRHLSAGVLLGFAFLEAWPCEGMVRKGTVIHK